MSSSLKYASLGGGVIIIILIWQMGIVRQIMKNLQYSHASLKRYTVRNVLGVFISVGKSQNTYGNQNGLCQPLISVSLCNQHTWQAGNT